GEAGPRFAHGRRVTGPAERIHEQPAQEGAVSSFVRLRAPADAREGLAQDARYRAVEGRLVGGGVDQLAQEAQRLDHVLPDPGIVLVAQSVDEREILPGAQPS